MNNWGQSYKCGVNSLKKNDKVFIMSSAAVVIGALRLKIASRPSAEEDLTSWIYGCFALSAIFIISAHFWCLRQDGKFDCVDSSS